MKLTLSFDDVNSEQCAQILKVLSEDTAPTGWTEHNDMIGGRAPEKITAKPPKAKKKPAAASKKEQAKIQADPPAAVDLSEVREKFTRYVSEASPQAAVKLLGEFGVGRVSELNASQYGDFLGRLVDLLK